MVTTWEPPVAAQPGPRTSFGVPTADMIEHLCVAVLATAWLFYVIPSSGGFHDPRTAVGLVAAAPALLATRPWRHLGRVPIVLVVWLAVGGLVTMSVTPMGWAQADSVADHVAGAVVLAVVASYARTPARRVAVLVVLVLALFLQFMQAWTPWWGSGDPNHLMVGTFYWHNQLAIYMAALALMAVVVSMIGEPPLQRAAVLAAPLGAAAVVFSTSRTSLGLLVLGWLASAALIWKARRRRKAAGRWALVPLLTVAAVLALTSPLFFPNGHYNGLAATQEQATVTSPAGERGLSSLGNNGGDRVTWTEAALRGWADEPLTGHGFDSFLYTSQAYLSEGDTLSRFVHNAYAEALTSGGLLFGGPVVLGVLLLLVLCVRGAVRAVRADVTERPVLAASCLASGVLLAHAAVDFDWHYAGLIVLLGAIGGVAVAVQRPAVQRRPLPAAPTAVALLLAVAIGAAGAYVEHRDRRLSRPVHANATAEVTRLLVAQLPATYDPRLTIAALRRSIASPPQGPDRLAVPAALAKQAYDRTDRVARLEPFVALQRAEVGALTGSAPSALSDAAAILADHPVLALSMYPTYLQVAAIAGQYDAARAEATRDVQARLGSKDDADAAWGVLRAFAQLDTPAQSAGRSCLFTQLEDAYGTPPPGLSRPSSIGSCPP